MGYKDFFIRVEITAPDNFTESDVKESVYNLFRGFGSMLDAGLVEVREI